MQVRSRAGIREIGDLLRKAREAANLSQREVGATIGRSGTHVHRMETGESAVLSEIEVIHFLAACGVSNQEIRCLVQDARDANDDRGHWLRPAEPWMHDSLQSLVFHESRAERSVSYEPDLIPGLLQVESYAREVMSRTGASGDYLDSRVKARMERQHILDRTDTAQFAFFIRERALRAPIGEPAVMEEQLTSLALSSNHPKTMIRVVPESSPQAVILGGPLCLFTFADHATLAYVECHLGGLFVDNPTGIEQFKSVLRTIAGAALTVEESRAMLVALIDEHDRAGGLTDDQWQVADQQFQRRSRG